MICRICGKKFVRTPPHPRKMGLRINCRAKLCPKCRKKVHSEVGKVSRKNYPKKLFGIKVKNEYPPQTLKGLNFNLYEMQQKHL